MTFLAGQAVTWNGAECVVEMVRESGTVALTRARDGMTIITDSAVLASQQVLPKRLPRASLLGDA